MSNASAATFNTSGATKATKSTEKKVSLWERFKKYLFENSEIISAGVIAMNGGTYIPPRTK